MATVIGLIMNSKCQQTLVTTSKNNLLSFIEDQKYIPQLNNNNSIKGIFCTQEIASSGLIRADIDLIIVNEPKWFFFSIIDYLAKNQERQPTIIDSSSEISPHAYISPVGVKIGKNCKIDPNVTILSDVTIGDNVVIRAGSVVGTDGFEHKKTAHGILSVAHNGEVIIHDNVARSVKNGETVTGNFAIPHQKFLKNFKRSLADD